MVDWEEGGSPRIRPRDKGMTTVARSSWQSRAAASARLTPFLSLSFSVVLLRFYSAHERRTDGRRNSN